MKISLSKTTESNRIERLTERHIIINGQGFAGNLIVAPNRSVCPWDVNLIDALTTSDFALVLDWHPSIVLLGTGQQHLMPKAHLLAEFLSRNIALESMTTQAACHTYNLLVDDQRDVVACLMR